MTTLKANLAAAQQYTQAGKPLKALNAYYDAIGSTNDIATLESIAQQVSQLPGPANDYLWWGETGPAADSALGKAAEQATTPQQAADVLKFSQSLHSGAGISEAQQKLDAFKKAQDAQRDHAVWWNPLTWF